MKILMFGWEFPPFNSGGLGVACYGLTRALSKFGHEVIFVLPKKLEVSSDFMKIIFADMPNVDIKVFESYLKEYLTSASYRKLLLEKDEDVYARNLYEEVIRYAKYAKKIAKEESFDVIHAHDWLSFLAGVTAKEISKKPLVVHIHATEFDRSGDNAIDQNIYEIEKEGFQNADKIIAVSEATKNKVVEKYKIQPDKISVVHNGIDQDEIENITDLDNRILKLKKRGYKIVLFLGRITMQKGPDYFVKAAKKVLNYFPKTLFLIAGSGDMERELIEEVARLKISDKVLFVGFVRGAEKNKLYKSADLFVMPSVSEPFGLVALESVLNNTPVLISKQSGVSEVVHNALKVDFWDVDEMVNKIIAVLKLKPLKKELVYNALKETKKLSWLEAAKKTSKVYEDVAS